MPEALFSLILLAPVFFSGERFHSVSSNTEKIVRGMITEFKLKPGYDHACIPLPWNRQILPWLMNGWILSKRMPQNDLAESEIRKNHGRNSGNVPVCHAEEPASRADDHGGTGSYCGQQQSHKIFGSLIFR
jgi:hypothetical protein